MITVMLVDDQELIRIGLKAVLSHDPEIKVVADLDNGLMPIVFGTLIG